MFHIYQQSDTRLTSEATMYPSHSVAFSLTSDDLWWFFALHILALNKFWCMCNSNRYDTKNTQIFTAKNIVLPFHDYKHMITYTQISEVLGHERLCFQNSYAYYCSDQAFPVQNILIPLCQKLKFYTTQIHYAHCHSTLLSLTSEKGTSLCNFSVPGLAAVQSPTSSCWNSLLLLVPGWRIWVWGLWHLLKCSDSCSIY